MQPLACNNSDEKNQENPLTAISQKGGPNGTGPIM